MLKQVKVYGCAGTIAGLFVYMNNEMIRSASGMETYTEKAVNIVSPHIDEVYTLVRGLI